MFYLTEQFLSIQGEGKYAGTPSYFLRTGGCNLTCAGFGAKYVVDGEDRVGCDTYFAVDSKFTNLWERVDNSDTLIGNLFDKFDAIGYDPHIVITGGEPLLYYADKVFYALVEAMVDRGILITFETNGTIEIDFEAFPAYKKTMFALSIKLDNSGEAKSKRIRPQAIENIINYSKDSFFKFTIDKPLVDSSAFDEIREITDGFDTDIYCMPVGESRDTIWRNDKAVFEFCVKHNFLYSDRLHIRVFDTTQGV